MARKTKTTATACEEFYLMRPPTMHTAEDVARYLEQDFTEMLWMVADLVEAGAYCPWPLLHDLARLPRDLARVLRGAGPIEFETDGSRDAADELTRALTDLVSRLVDGDEFETPAGRSGLCDSTLSTLAKLIREAQRPGAAAGVS